MSKQAKVPGTQRAWFTRLDITLHPTQTFDNEQLYLVIPEAAVKGCKHDCYDEGWHYWCSLCGSHKANGRWKRPRLLRVARSKSK